MTFGDAYRHFFHLQSPKPFDFLTMWDVIYFHIFSARQEFVCNWDTFPKMGIQKPRVFIRMN